VRAGGAAMKWCVASVVAGALAGCNAVYNLEATKGPADAPPLADEDSDGIADVTDNCPQDANDQADADEDGRGDVCDNCPLVANPQQERTGDADGVGDVCDAHPDVNGDCLVLLDSFDRSDQLMAGWSLTSASGSAPALTFDAGSVTIAPVDAAAVSVLALDAQGAALQGSYDTQLLGRAMPTTGTVYVVSNMTTVDGDVYACSVTTTGGVARASASNALSVTMRTSSLPLSADPVDSSVLLRLTSKTTDGSIGCRADHGLAIGAAQYPPSARLTAGAPGVVLVNVPATLDAIALYREQPDPCPPPIYR
jgi:hypothetical protein